MADNGLDHKKIEAFYQAAGDYHGLVEDLGMAETTLRAEVGGVGLMTNTAQLSTLLTDARKAAAEQVHAMVNGMQVWSSVNYQLYNMSSELLRVNTDVLNAVIRESSVR